MAEGNDLLEKQLLLMESIENSNETSIKRAEGLYEAWLHVM
jgi:hypothetical protein